MKLNWIQGELCAQVSLSFFYLKPLPSELRRRRYLLNEALLKNQ